MPTMAELLDMPGETRFLTGFVRRVEVKDPDDRAIANAQKGGYQAKTKTQIIFQANGLEDRTVAFDPKEYPVKEVLPLAGAFVTLECVVRQYTLDNGKTGETTKLSRVRKIYRDANGVEPPAKS